MRSAISAAVVGLSLLVAGCSAGTAPNSPGSSTATETIPVVASTNVWGSVVEAVGGDAVTVTSVIDDPDKDPHEYQADARTQLALSNARLVIQNGGGYDDFVTTMLSAAKSKPTTIDAADVSGYDQNPSDGEFNEHVWYDFPTVIKVADRIATDLSTLRPEQAETFKANAATLTSEVKKLQDQEGTIKAAHGGAGVAITEPVPLYLLQACGLVNKTPDAFSEAIEEDTDVAPAVLNQTLALFTGKQVKLLVYNEQTGGPQTERVLAAAKSQSVPAVPVTETLPSGQTYLSWMKSNLDAISAGLGS